MGDTPFVHTPVLLTETLDLWPLQAGWYLDCTVGGGGHAANWLTRCPQARLLAVDRDADALAAAQRRLAPFADRVAFWHGNFADLRAEGRRFWGILADLGVSSPQLDRSERGFGFQRSGPLDMRMDRTQSLTAADVVNTWGETDLANLIYRYGEERYSRAIARRLVAQRPFANTQTLAQAIAAAVPPAYRHGRIHPATRTFQALRLAVNQELESLARWLGNVATWLEPGGVVAVISFHSLEDRLVKHALRENPALTVLTKKPLTASTAEQQTNPRARSAKLRGARLACSEQPEG
ncbi:MAG TPA: 16S rRNA (cytosine(1402)-N(4))-methyltransferase [Cyanobacteria bacterium UBA8156]|jgi:16S rRNA (cytosine1402-N4)-methyltransferase|nr:16S rRNA (cytosine(1402)-N(4))-methyltransferase [Cyanobacteria bacterium UBA8156]